jgi:hypothetical protein
LEPQVTWSLKRSSTAVAGNRTLIDPKYDSRAKHVTQTSFKFAISVVGIRITMFFWNQCDAVGWSLSAIGAAVDDRCFQLFLS